MPILDRNFLHQSDDIERINNKARQQTLQSMSSLTRRLRARFNNLFLGTSPPPALPPPKPSTPQSPPPESLAELAASKRKRRIEKIITAPIHPDFLSNVDPLYPISEEALKANALNETSATRKLHP